MRKLAVGALLLTVLQTGLASPQDNLSKIAVQAAVAPIYPLWALGNTGDVKVIVTVDRDGNVSSAEFLSGDLVLRKAVVDAAKRWRFVRPDQPVKVELTFSFRVMLHGTPAEELTPIYMPPYHVEVRGELPATTQTP